MNKNAVSFMKERGDWEALFSYLYSRSEYDLIIELYTELKNRNEDISSSMEMIIKVIQNQDIDQKNFD